MNLKHLTDQQLAMDIKYICQKERVLLTQVLYHLKEIESRKLYSSFGYSSLFNYACNELKYSSDQAYRRIQAMRLLKDIPEVAVKIDSGELSLSNITQAQKYFKDTKVLTNESMNKSEKITLLKKLINKSVRDGQKELLKLSPNPPLPIDTKKQVTPTHTYVGFTMSDELEKKLEKIKSLLGPKAYDLNMSDLINLMADLAKEKLEEKKFGKKLAARTYSPSSNLINLNENEDSLPNETKIEPSILNVQSKLIKKPTLEMPKKLIKKSILNETDDIHHTKCKFSKSGLGQTRILRNTTLEKPIKDVNKTILKNLKENQHSGSQFLNNILGQSSIINDHSRYISKKLKYKIWQKNSSKCCHCSSQFNLQLDHIIPYALNGKTSEENLRLLCFNCNQRKKVESGL